MKRFALCFILIAAASGVANAADAELIGGLKRGASLGVALRPVEGGSMIDAVGPGTSAEAMGLKAGDKVVSVDGKPVKDTGMLVAKVGRKRAGEWITLVVKRGDQTQTLVGKLKAAPIERQSDYDIGYGSVEVNGSKRRVIVTRPRGDGKHPAVLLIGGIGCYSLDGLLRAPDPKQPYAKLLDGFTRAGYVTMRVEKSGMGDSEGVPCNDPRSDFEAELAGYKAGLKQLESLDSVDPAKVFLFAHSIGPLHAARIASEHPVKGIVVAETVGTGWMEYELTNARRQLVLSGMPYDEIDRNVRHHEQCVHRLYVDKKTPAQILAADKTCAEDLQMPAPYTYMQQVGALDLAPLWKKIDAPVLIFYGTADFVTDAYQARYLRDMINAFHPDRAKYVEVEGMDHGFQLAGSQKASLEGAPDAPFAQKVLDETLKFFGS